ncbi:LEM domain-containing protein 2 [Rhinoderma darwinii]|uniref:LEM domain-containing protein 2 n=1 Tax=Rhinoderma darwinii TaxID=43563 RepID=UPI003F678CCF
MLLAGKMSDEKLRRELISLGFTPGPVTDSTRTVLKKKLEKLRAKKPRNSSDNPRRTWHQQPRDESDAEDEETHASDRRRSHGQYQHNDERASWEESNRRADRPDDSWYPAVTSISSPVRTEESALWKRPSDHSESSSIAYNRYSSDIPERSSIAYNRYSSDIPERSSIAYNRYSSDIPERSSIAYNRYSSDIPERSFNRYSSDNIADRSLGVNSYSGDEVRYRPIGDISRHQSTSPYVSSSRTALDSLSHKTHSGLRHEKVSHLKPAWSKRLEYYLSRLLWMLCVILILVFTGILVMKSGVLSTSKDNDIKLLPSDCKSREDPFCKAEQKKITFRILSELYDFLSLEAASFECGNPSGLSSKCIPVNRAKEHVMNVNGYAAEKFDAALDWMLRSDRHLGIWAKGEDTEELVTAWADVFCLESSRPRLGFVCRLKNALYTAISNLFLSLLGIFLLWMIMIFLRYHWQSLEEEEKQMFVMVEKIIDVVKHHYKDWRLNREQNPYVAILHVRDTLIIPQDRKPLQRVWDRAVRYFETNETRVQIEMQRVSGKDLKVWRWT